MEVGRDARLRSLGLCVAHCRGGWKGGGPYCLFSVFISRNIVLAHGEFVLRCAFGVEWERGIVLCCDLRAGGGLEGGLCARRNVE
jgi:hypothetical protein